MRNALFLLIVVLALTGCRTGYDITLNNNTKFTNVSKPVLDREAGVYRFKVAGGEERTVKAMRVRTIEPHGDTPETKFNPPSQRY